MENEIIGGFGQILTEVAGSAESDLIRFFVLVVVGLFVFILWYRLYSKHRKERTELDMKRFQHESEVELDKKKHEAELEHTRAERETGRANDMLSVVTANTVAMQQLTALIDTVNTKTESGHIRIHKRLDETLSALNTRPCMFGRDTPPLRRMRIKNY
jgi:hypothetical protein